MITTTTNDFCYEFRGLHTDVKPIGNNCVNGNVNYAISNGSTFFEMDTSKVYMFSIVQSTVDEETVYTGTWLAI